MALVNYKPTSDGRRFMTRDDFSDITASRPLKKLIEGMKRKGGRNRYGRITVPRRGGGHRKIYRNIDFRRDKIGVSGFVKTIEYDPNRSARIALVSYVDGEKRYILAPDGLKVGDKILSSRHADVKVGNCMPLAVVPPGTMIHAIELQPKGGAKLVRSAGGSAQLLAKEGAYGHVRLPSGEVRKVLLECRAVIGQVSNIEHQNISWGKAGRMRWKGLRPRVRAVAMNPVDHPMGGGEGRSKGGRHPCNRRGVPAKGYKTRKNKSSLKYIVKHRGKK
jgi:large subunit ribosomal protein L2